MSIPADSYLVPLNKNKGLLENKKEKTMKQLIMKARSGVTLVELLVVVLIVTILSVSMLPLLMPFVTESQYAAEAIPVIGNIRTKIGVYVYDRGHLPYDEVVYSTYGKVETWDVKSGTETDLYEPAVYTFAAAGQKRTSPQALTKITNPTQKGGHITSLLDIDYQDLKGKRSKPVHYQYLAVSTNTSSYVVGCFGNGEGLKRGTGYAVCELNFPAAGRKLIGTWKRYKSYNDDAGAIIFTQTYQPDSSVGKTLDCYVPPATEVNAALNNTQVDSLVKKMTGAGWEF